MNKQALLKDLTKLETKLDKQGDHIRAGFIDFILRKYAEDEEDTDTIDLFEYVKKKEQSEQILPPKKPNEGWEEYYDRNYGGPYSYEEVIGEDAEIDETSIDENIIATLDIASKPYGRAFRRIMEKHPGGNAEKNLDKEYDDDDNLLFVEYEVEYKFKYEEADVTIEYGCNNDREEDVLIRMNHEDGRFGEYYFGPGLEHEEILEKLEEALDGDSDEHLIEGEVF